MKQIVIGLGRIGQPLLEVLSKIYNVEGWDENTSLFMPPPEKHGCIHICFPYFPHFIESTSYYQRYLSADLVIIHSTVPIGTTRQIPNAVHSPVVTKGAAWRSDIRKDLCDFVKWIGGSKCREAEAILSGVGMKCKTMPQPEHTEALKLLCLAKYGAYIAVSHYVKEVCIKVGLDNVDVRNWDNDYNMHSHECVKRPHIYPHGEAIGGSCVIPVVEMLKEQFPHEILDGILRYK